MRFSDCLSFSKDLTCAQTISGMNSAADAVGHVSVPPLQRYLHVVAFLVRDQSQTGDTGQFAVIQQRLLRLKA